MWNRLEVRVRTIHIEGTDATAWAQPIALPELESNTELPVANIWTQGEPKRYAMTPPPKTTRDAGPQATDDCMRFRPLVVAPTFGASEHGREMKQMNLQKSETGLPHHKHAAVPKGGPLEWTNQETPQELTKYGRLLKALAEQKWHATVLALSCRGEIRQTEQDTKASFMHHERVQVWDTLF